jgi:hypothetical protein
MRRFEQEANLAKHKKTLLNLSTDELKKKFQVG